MKSDCVLFDGSYRRVRFKLVSAGESDENNTKDYWNQGSSSVGQRTRHMYEPVRVSLVSTKVQSLDSGPRIISNIFALLGFYS